MYHVKCFVGFCLVHRSDESTDDVSDKLSDDNEDEMWMIYYMTSLVWLVFDLLLKLMIQHTMYPTSHLRASIQTKNIIVFCDIRTGSYFLIASIRTRSSPLIE